MPFKVHFYVALFLLNSCTILSAFGSQARNNLVPNSNHNNNNNNNNNHHHRNNSNVSSSSGHSTNNNNNSSNYNNNVAVARSNSDVMDAGILQNHSNDDFVYTHLVTQEQQDTAPTVVESIKMTKESGRKNSTENEKGNFYIYILYQSYTVYNNNNNNTLPHAAVVGCGVLYLKILIKIVEH